MVDDDGKRILSIIDFGDMLDTWLVLEPAIAATYAMMQQSQPDLAASLGAGAWLSPASWHCNHRRSV